MTKPISKRKQVKLRHLARDLGVELTFEPRQIFRGWGHELRSDIVSIQSPGQTMVRCAGFDRTEDFLLYMKMNRQEAKWEAEGLARREARAIRQLKDEKSQMRLRLIVA